MNGYTVTGGLGFACCRMAADGTAGTLSGEIVVQSTAPLLYAVVTGPPEGMTMTLTSPDGTTYDQAVDTEDALVVTGAGGPLAILVPRPRVGRWKLSCSVTAEAKGGVALMTAASMDPVSKALLAFGPYLKGAAGRSLGDFELFREVFRPFATLLTVVPPAPAVGLPNFAAHVLGLHPQSAAAVLAWIRDAGAEAKVIALAQALQRTGTELWLDALVNGSGENGLAGWDVTEGRWRTTRGAADALGWTPAFAADGVTGPCRKVATIDLLAADLTPLFLDAAPPIDVSGWFCAIGSPGSTYSLTARLLDGSREVLKEVRTTTVEIPPAANAALPGRDDWRAVLVPFRNYGPGARYVEIEHASSDPDADATTGFRITGARVRILLSLPDHITKELVVNPDGADGLAGWTTTGPAAWSTETGPGVACPQTANRAVFAVASGQAVKRQSIDLIAAGYQPAFLDTAPPIRVGQWMAADPEVACTYTFKVVLRDAAGVELVTADPGETTLGPLDLPGAAFLPYSHRFAGYGPGLRTIDVEHSAQPQRAVAGRNPAMLTGTTVKILSQPSVPAATVPPQEQSPAVTDPTVAPYRWVCQLSMVLEDGRTHSGTGFLIPADGTRFFVVTAAHNLCYQDRWAETVLITPGVSGLKEPYSVYEVKMKDVEVPIDWLVLNQADVAPTWWFFPQYSYDYALIRVEAPLGWDSGGFALASSDQCQLDGQPARLTGYPAEKPYTQMPVPNLYTADVKVSPYDSTRGQTVSDMGRGASGGPVYVSPPGGGHQAIGIVTSADRSSVYLRLLDQDVRTAIDRWRRPLSDDDRVCKLQLVVMTGGQPIIQGMLCVIDGHTYDLLPLWERSSGHRFGWTWPTTNAVNVFDLTPELFRAHETQPLLRDLLGKAWSLAPRADRQDEAWAYFFTGEWDVRSVALYVNGQLLYVRTRDGSTQVAGTIQRGRDQ